MAANAVIEGDYKHKPIYAPTGKPYIHNGMGKAKRVYISRDTVTSYDVVDEDSRKSAGSGVARGLVGGALLGPVGAVAGGLSAKNKRSITIAIEFKDGKRSLLEVDGNLYKAIVQALF